MQKPTIIIPCAGKSSRYPNLRPKFLLINPNGNLMFQDAISKLNLRNCNIVVTVLKEHEQEYGLKGMFKKFFPKFQLCVLDKPTKSQSETVCVTLKQMQIGGPFLIKDSDNIFKMHQIKEDFNYVAVENLENIGAVNPCNKSYVLYDSSGIITNIEEKKIISDTFSVGGYYFTEPQKFIKIFNKLSKSNLDGEIYVSKIINYLIFNNQAKFKIKNVSEYLDLGTINEWMDYKDKIKTYFIDIDGVIVENGGEYWKPYWGTTQGLPENIKLIQKLYEQGNQIVLFTARKAKYREITIKQLKKNNIKYNHLIMGLFHSQRILINDFTDSNPYPSAVAVNIPRNLDELNKYLKTGPVDFEKKT